MNNENELDKYLILVNKKRPLTEETEAWLKENFEYVPYTDEDGPSYMEAETFKAYTSLVKFMKKKYHLEVDSHSAWRSKDTQAKVYEEAKKIHEQSWIDTHVAEPGQSEHHTGLAFDLRFKPPIIPEALRGKFNTVAKITGMRKKIFATIEKEAVQFGLIKRYQPNKQSETGFDEEEWHFRYVGVEHAKAMYESGMCLEEYVRKLQLQNDKAEKKSKTSVR